MSLLSGLTLVTVAASGSVSPAVHQAIGLRGGSLVIPLTSSPTTPVEVSLGSDEWSGRTLDANVVWLHGSRHHHAGWAVPAIQVSISETDDLGGTPYLVTKVPEDAQGDLLVDGHVVLMTWHTLPDAMPELRARSAPQASEPWPPMATPPLDDPTRSWRCELVAMMHGWPTPPIDRFESPEANLVAIATTGIWRFALHRLHELDAGVARQVALLLTHTFDTPQGPAAGWLTEQRSIATLLALLTGEDDADDPIAARALRWCERQTAMLVWIDSDRGNRVTVTGGNPTTSSGLVELSWARPYELPVAMPIPPQGMAREAIEPLPDHELIQLLVQAGQNHLVLPVDRSIPTIEPPGLMMGPFHPVRGLGDIRSGQMPPPLPASEQTFAQLRRLAGQWELMFECRWPSDPQRREGEAVTTMLTCGDARTTIVVTPHGSVTISDKSMGDVSAHTAIQSHSWLCRLVLPTGWGGCEAPAVAMMRTHAWSGTAVTWPTPCTPWNVVLDPTRVDLTGWDQDAATPAP
ncbi:MAG: hypothetical protein QF561_05695 [Phycisphaerales bacterium]|jgi:hypothetical protein|nr:hypothetical protein [Phycisphaerales bacterium]